MKLGRICAIVLALSLYGCATMAVDPLIPTAQPIHAPKIYQQWYQEIEDCVGRSFPFWRIRWFYVDSDYFMCGPIPGAIGCTAIDYSGGPEIYLAKGRLDDHDTVKHEMIHVVLHGPGGNAHPEPPFEECEYVIGK